MCLVENLVRITCNCFLKLILIPLFVQYMVKKCYVKCLQQLLKIKIRIQQYFDILLIINKKILLIDDPSISLIGIIYQTKPEIKFIETKY